ncbi:MAG: mycofactocin biosynthesis glycosyltransferase MftF [Jatrophihabitans sp.]
MTDRAQPAIVPLPAGIRLTLDAGTRQLDAGTLFGGAPARILRLSAAGRAAFAELAAGPVHDGPTGRLARRLTDAGVSHPQVQPVSQRLDLTVLIPVRDRPELLARCLQALGADYPVLVVDDGSDRLGAIAEVARAHGARLLVRASNGGPGAARNTGLDEVSSEFVALIDSDCIPPAGWLAALAGHLADPLVAAVAPRIVALPAAGWAGRLSQARCGLDLGPQPARVLPTGRVRYLPTAALLVRRSSLLAVGQPPHGGSGPFDERLRVGEDVDLIWRLHGAGWRIRYAPEVSVGHREPGNWSGLLRRRFRYGTSAAPLALRHPSAMAPLVLRPWPTATVAGLLAGAPALAAAGFGGSVLANRRSLRRAGVPAGGVLRASAGATVQTWLGLGRYSTQFWAAVLLGSVVRPGGHRRAHWRRVATASLLLGPPLAGWWRDRPDLDLASSVAGQLADDLAYGAGVWAGVLAERTTIPLRPVLHRRPVRIEPQPHNTP